MSTPSLPPWQPVGETLSASGEAPFWHMREERLYWIDVPLRRIWRWHQPSGHTEHWDLPQPVTGMAPCRSGGLLLVMGQGLWHAAAWGDTPMPLADAPAGAPAGSLLRGGRCDPWGRFWLLHSTLPSSGRPGQGTLHCLPPRSTPRPALLAVRRGVPDIQGWACSPDGRRVVWCHPDGHVIEEAVLGNPGRWPPELGMPITLARFDRPRLGANLPLPGKPSSGAMDQQGRYWVALADAGRVVCLDAQGQWLSDIPVPALQPSGLCFGGADMRTLFLTTARAHRSETELARYPRCGGVFALAVDTPGLPTAVYWD